jgi:hypothetical protein
MAANGARQLCRLTEAHQALIRILAEQAVEDFLASSDNAKEAANCANTREDANQTPREPHRAVRSSRSPNTPATRHTWPASEVLP